MACAQFLSRCLCHLASTCQATYEPMELYHILMVKEKLSFLPFSLHFFLSLMYLYGVLREEKPKVSQLTKKSCPSHLSWHMCDQSKELEAPQSPLSWSSAQALPVPSSLCSADNNLSEIQNCLHSPVALKNPVPSHGDTRPCCVSISPPATPTLFLITGQNQKVSEFCWMCLLLAMLSMCSLCSVLYNRIFTSFLCLH